MMVLLMGGLAFYDIIVGDQVPSVKQLGRLSPVVVMGKLNTTEHMAKPEPQETQQYWDSLQPTMKCLDSVVPEAATWIEELNSKNKIVYQTEKSHNFASYDYVSGELTISWMLFQKNDAVKASILAHEFRHSRQTFYKFAKYVLSYAILRELRQDLVETDAYLYESQVKASLTGNVFESWEISSR